MHNPKSKQLRQTPTNPKTKPKILATRKYTWLDHAMRHYGEGAITETIIQSSQESLMYLSLFANEGMFE